MGQGEPGDDGRGGDHELIAMAGELPHGGSATVKYLKDWELNGATWRAVEVTDDHAVIDLCTCYGERMDRVEGDDPELIAYVREHGGASEH